MFKVMKNVIFFCIFTRFGLFPQFFGQLMEWPILELHEMIRVLRVVACPVGFMIEIAREECSKCCLGPFPQVFWQVKEWLMLELHKIIRLSDVVVCRIVFSWFYE